MSSPLERNLETRELRVLVGIGILVVGLLVWGSRRSSPPPPTESAPARKAAAWHGQIDYMADPDKAAAQIDLWAKQTHGDFSKLKYEERRWLDGVTSGHGAIYLAYQAKHLQQQEEAARRRAARKAPTHAAKKP